MMSELEHFFFLFFSSPQLRVLERIGARALVAHVRTFADFLVYEFSTSPGGPQLNKCIEILNDMVWKYNIVTLDRLILCLVRRNLHAKGTSHPCTFHADFCYDFIVAEKFPVLSSIVNARNCEQTCSVVRSVMLCLLCFMTTL